MTTLKTRFEEFIRKGKGFESIDHLMKSCELEGRKSADYFLCNRAVIIEQKSLDIDPTQKVQQFIDELIYSRNIIVYGSRSLGSILRTQPDAEILNRKFVSKMNRPIDSIFADADKQIKDTRDTFFAYNAVSLLVILNEVAGALPPDIVLVKIRQMFYKKLDGVIRYPHIEGAIVISEAHTVEHDAAPIALPIIAEFPPEGSRRDRAKFFAGQLAQNWATFNGCKLVESDTLTFQQRNPKPLQWKLPTTSG